MHTAQLTIYSPRGGGNEVPTNKLTLHYLHMSMYSIPSLHKHTACKVDISVRLDFKTNLKDLILLHNVLGEIPCPSKLQNTYRISRLPSSMSKINRRIMSNNLRVKALHIHIGDRIVQQYLEPFYRAKGIT